MTTTKPEYAPPTSLTAAVVEATSAEVVFTTSPYANYFTVQVANNDDFERARKFFLELNVNGATVEDLKPGTKYWARVAVCNYEGVRLSPWSSVKTFRTAVAP